MMQRVALALGLGLLALTTPLAAQQGLSLGTGFLAASTDGEDFTGVRDRYGLDLVARYGWSGWSLGAGGQVTWNGNEGIGENTRTLGLFLEPRVYLGSTLQTRWMPYVLARAALLWTHLETGGSRITSHGTSFLGGLGFLYRLGERWDVDAGVSFGYLGFGDITVDGNRLDDTGMSGTSFGARVGFTYGLGRRPPLPEPEWRRPTRRARPR